ncbi:MAG: alpha/beta fold hydrolase [Reyranella sp.]|uniref:alpha/beta hydrolase family protein n=1 Tax=Reyranella sp. TaxID=1929291 RepID=UPI0027319555|nr:alpha/beta fold hydrolase [Reyranella sp.]MDP1965797.1 alpha/beta fold hydrolase [Reyranella sp.]MDP2377710.1 alpha/beta fold hydrolase [Reyranella sp.]
MDLMLAARDGTKLAATLFASRTPNGGAILINSGTGIARQFYATFAGHLSERGFTVLTYDYRGIGGSEKPPSATMEQWGGVDQASMIDHLASLVPGAPRAVIGHSFGGQVLGLADNIRELSAAVLICSQSGHWRHWPPGRRRLRMLALWWLLIPGLTAATGRFPGSWIGTANLPAGIARSWARWGRSPHYVCDAWGQKLRPYNDEILFPIRWMSFSDDPIAPLGAVEALLPYYPSATIERLHLSPSDLGAESVGHFGFFRKSMPRQPWDEIADWLGDRMRQTGRQQQLEESPAWPHRTFSPRSRTASAG